MKTLRWILFIPAFILINSFAQYLYMELVEWILGSRINYGGETIWFLSSIHHVILFLGFAVLVIINNVLMLIPPKMKLGVKIYMLIYLVGLIIRYIVVGIHFTWYEFYFLLGVLATFYAFINATNKAEQLKELKMHS